MDYVQFILAHQVSVGMQCLEWQKVELELIPDPDLYIFFEKNTRGGISYISNRCSKANNKYLKSYDPKQESKHIKYLGAKNLCGYAMSKFLLTSGFKWIDPKEFDLNKYTSNSSKGYVLEVDLEYHKELRELHNDCPFVFYYENLQLYLRLGLKQKMHCVLDIINHV